MQKAITSGSIKSIELNKPNGSSIKPFSVGQSVKKIIDKQYTLDLTIDNRTKRFRVIQSGSALLYNVAQIASFVCGRSSPMCMSELCTPKVVLVNASFILWIVVILDIFQDCWITLSCPFIDFPRDNIHLNAPQARQHDF